MIIKYYATIKIFLHITAFKKSPRAEILFYIIGKAFKIRKNKRKNLIIDYDIDENVTGFVRFSSIVPKKNIFKICWEIAKEVEW